MTTTRVHIVAVLAGVVSCCLFSATKAHGQCAVATLVPADGAAGDLFGTSLAIDGDTIVVGVPIHGGSTGAAYVFVHQSGQWQQQAKLGDLSVIIGDEFGRSVSVSGDFAAIGTPKHDFGGRTNAGRVYMFRRTGTTWANEALPTPAFITTVSEFGTSVSADGDAVLVGAPLTDGVSVPPSNFGNSGSAYVFRRNANTGFWSQEGPALIANDASELDQFGFTVLLSGNFAFVTAFNDKDPSISQSNTIGSVYVFTNQNGTWTQTQKLVASDAAAQAMLGIRNFGRSLSSDGQVLLVGERGGQSAYVFRFNGVLWVEEAILKKPMGNTASDQFGHSVAIEDDFAFVGATVDDDNMVSNSGTAFAFRRVGGTWINQSLLYADMPTANGRLGTSMAVDGGVLAVGAIEALGTYTGTVHVFSTSAAVDCDGNGVSDECEILDDPGLDANGNGVLDACDCAADEECDDGLDCTVDSCNLATSLCDFLLVPDMCRINGVCYAAGAPNVQVHCQLCDPAQSTSAWSAAPDGIVCDPPQTQCMVGGFCQSAQCVQVPKPVGAPCGDPSASDCDDPDICDGAGTCFSNPKPNNFPCTDNGQFCDGLESCRLGQCRPSSINPCSSMPGTPICDEELDRCVECAQNFECIDNVECTVDFCNDDGLCQNDPAPAGTFCGSSVATICDGRDTCNGAGACQSHLAPVGTLCGSITMNDCNQPDTCNALGDCLANFATNGTVCTPNGVYCDGVEQCQSGVCVSPGPLPCASAFNCNEATDSCFLCTSSAQCNDGNLCTNDICAASGACLHSPTAPGAPCGTDEICDTQRTCAGGQCVGSFTPNGTPCVPDIDICTFDVCQNGVCAHLPAEFAQPCGPDDCNCNRIFDLCEIDAGDAEDCNHNLIPDECEQPRFMFDSGNLSPIGDGFPQTFMAADLPTALDDVTLSVYAQADLYSSSEWIDLSINGQFVHRFFTVLGFDCPNADDVESIVLPLGQFYSLVPTGSADVLLTASAQVRADLCTPTTHVRVTLEYLAPGEGDCNGNQVPDECDLAADPASDCNGNEILDWCEIAAGTLEDCNNDGIPDQCEQGSTCEITVLTAATSHPDYFGYAVSKHGNYLLVGAPGTACAAGDGCGAAYIAKVDSGGVGELKELPRPIDEAGAEFGVSVAIADNWAIVGARYQSCADGPNCGAVYVYGRADENWYFFTSLRGSQVNAGDQFGYSVTIDGDIAAIGAIYEECLTSPPYSCGAAYVYRYDGVQWSEDEILNASSEDTGDWFGSSVAIDGDLIVVGAQNHDCEGILNCGASYVYRHNGMSWIEEVELTPSITDSANWAGFSVAVSGGNVVVGAPLAPCLDGTVQCGMADVYHHNGISWDHTQSLRSSYPGQSDYFGWAVAASGTMIAVGAPSAACPTTTPDCGNVFLYDDLQGVWAQNPNILSDPGLTTFFGRSLSMDSTDVALGAERNDCINCGRVSIHALHTSDCNCNSIPDACEIADGLADDCNANREPDECELADGWLTDVDPADGVPDECVLQYCNDFNLSDPPNCAVDSGQPYDPSNPTQLQGWALVDLIMPSTCPLAGLYPDDFEITVIPADVIAPSIQQVAPVAGLFRLELSTPIPPEHWTCITLRVTGKMQCVGFLPGDVNGGSLMEIGDIFSMLIGLWLPSLATDARYDVNRSGTLTAEDLIVEQDLFNGAGAFDPWLNRMITQCPTP